jgi:hypothetical protein
MAILQITDFENSEFNIQFDSYSEAELETCIDKHEKSILIDLLGIELYKLFKGDLSGTPEEPQTAPYTTIFEEILVEINGCNIHSEGIKQMLIQFIYYYFMVDQQHSKRVIGGRNTKGENSEPNTSYNLNDAYNQGVENYHAIQAYINENIADFPLFNGVCKGFTSGI